MALRIDWLPALLLLLLPGTLLACSDSDLTLHGAWAAELPRSEAPTP